MRTILPLAAFVLSLPLATIASSPALPSVRRTAPALSPRDASTPKSTPMAARVALTLTEPQSQFRITVRTNIDFFGCSGNPGCQPYDEEHIYFPQPAGVGLRLEFSNVINAQQWATAGLFWPPPFDIDNEAAWNYTSDQRPSARYWRTVPYVPDGFVAAAGSQQPWMNPKYAGLRFVGSTRKRKRTKRNRFNRGSPKSAGLCHWTKQTGDLQTDTLL